MATKTYIEKLKDPRWQKKRLSILSRDKFTCRLCGDDKTTLHVHHNKYHKEPWDCPDESLETVCSDCHSLITDEGESMNFRRVVKWKNDMVCFIFSGHVVSGENVIGLTVLNSDSHIIHSLGLSEAKFKQLSTFFDDHFNG